MNLFGNALRYAFAGFVRVSLSCSDIASPPNQGTKSATCLSVVDTGDGISIQQIIDSCGGVIEFNSEQGSRTEVKISLTFDNAMPSASLAADSDDTAITKV